MNAKHRMEPQMTQITQITQMNFFVAPSDRSLRAFTLHAQPSFMLE